MNRIEKLFQTKKQNILSIYFTAGYPALNDTLRTIHGLNIAGVDMIEIGMPFSDPVADGPVIQRSNEKALSNGMNLNLLFEQIARVREITDLPLILMGYLNPVYKFGIESFLCKCEKTGIDGVIIPDLPVEEYRISYEGLFNRSNILNIFMISPQTPDERIKILDSVSKGFLYMVSTSATTGAINKFDESSLAYFRKVDDLNLTTPRLIGFGISNNDTFFQVCNFANGAIIGSSFIRALEGNGGLAENINEFILKIKG
jgi:tryptophan synthase alpha chain